MCVLFFVLYFTKLLFYTFLALCFNAMDCPSSNKCLVYTCKTYKCYNTFTYKWNTIPYAFQTRKDGKDQEMIHRGYLLF